MSSQQHHSNRYQSLHYRQRSRYNRRSNKTKGKIINHRPKNKKDRAKHCNYKGNLNLQQQYLYQQLMASSNNNSNHMNQPSLANDPILDTLQVPNQQLPAVIVQNEAQQWSRRTTEFTNNHDEESSIEDFSRSASDIACYNENPSAVFSTLRSVTKKLLRNEDRYRTLDTTNPRVMERLLGFKGVLEFLMLLGFESDALGTKLICHKNPQQQVIYNAINVLNAYQQRFGGFNKNSQQRQMQHQMMNMENMNNVPVSPVSSDNDNENTFSFRLNKDGPEFVPSFGTTDIGNSYENMRWEACNTVRNIEQTAIPNIFQMGFEPVNNSNQTGQQSLYPKKEKPRTDLPSKKFLKVDPMVLSTVFGYTNEIELLFSNNNLYYTISIDIKWIITLYYNQSIDDILDWLESGGAQFTKLSFTSHDPEYVAPIAKTLIQKDEELCFIPHEYIMTSEIAKASEIGQQIIASRLDLRSKHSYLASYLLQEREKGMESKWHRYISILPRLYESVPLFFNQKQLRLLQGSMSIKKIEDRTDSLRYEYEALCRSIPEYNRFSFGDFMWARLCVITRIFGLRVDDVKTDGLVPIADFVHHRREKDITWTYDSEKRGFSIKAFANIPEGNEVFLTFGRKCNSRFFVNYGFVLENNPENEALLTFEFNKYFPNYSLKAQYLNIQFNHNSDSMWNHFQISRHYRHPRVQETFSFLRTLYAMDGEWWMIEQAFNGGYDLNTQNLPPLSIRNELDVLEALSISAQNSLDKFPDSLEYDNNLLKDVRAYPLKSNKRNIILMRRGEKEILTFYADLLKICKPFFDMKYKDLMDTLSNDERFKDSNSPIMQYINYIVVPLVQRPSS